MKRILMTTHGTGAAPRCASRGRQSAASRAKRVFPVAPGRLRQAALYALSMSTPAAERPSEALQKPAPGALYPWVKRVSYVELAVFAALIFFWLAPGFDDETFAFGLAHG